MRVDKAINIEDLHALAKRRLPRLIFDYLEGGADGEHCLARNEESFRRYRLLPRYLVDVAGRDQSTTLFGRTYRSPFGISPTGTAGLMRPGADMILAETARESGIPFILSSASNSLLEDVGKAAGGNAWCQIYPANDPKLPDHIMGRARDAGYETLVVTIDVPVIVNRERTRRSGFARVVKRTPKVIWDVLTHPAWLLDYQRAGYPLIENFVQYAAQGASREDVAAYYAAQIPARTQTWRDLDLYRRAWKGNLVVKGILSPDDARQAAEAGANGIIVSNHGGRQLDSAPAPIEVFPAIRDAVGDKLTLMIDSGVRRGSDIVVALSLGAKFVFFGRPTLYGVAAGGAEGVRRAVEILRAEINAVLGQIGRPAIDQLGPDCLWRPE